MKLIRDTRDCACSIRLVDRCYVSSRIARNTPLLRGLKYKALTIMQLTNKTYHKRFPLFGTVATESTGISSNPLIMFDVIISIMHFHLCTLIRMGEDVIPHVTSDSCSSWIKASRHTWNASNTSTLCPILRGFGGL